MSFDAEQLYVMYSGTGAWGDTPSYVPNSDDFYTPSGNPGNTFYYNASNGLYYVKVYPYSGGPDIASFGTITMNLSGISGAYSASAVITDHGHTTTANWVAGSSQIVFNNYVPYGPISECSVLVTAHDRWGRCVNSTVAGTALHCVSSGGQTLHNQRYSDPISLSGLSSSATVRANIVSNEIGTGATVSLLNTSTNTTLSTLSNQNIPASTTGTYFTFGNITLSGNTTYTNLQAKVVATGVWGDVITNTAVPYDASDGNGYVGHLTASFRTTATVSATVNSNYAVRDATILIKYNGVTRRTLTKELYGGSNVVAFSGVTLNPGEVRTGLSASVTAVGPWGYSLTAGNTATFSAVSASGVSTCSMYLNQTDPGNDCKDMSASHWNWVSFPRLPNQNYNAETLFNTLNGTAGGNVSEVLGHDHEHGQISLEWMNEAWSHNYLDNISSIYGYKVAMNNPVDDWVINGTIKSRYSTFPLYANEENWVGYYLPDAQNITQAFAAQWDNIKSIKSRKWYFMKEETTPTRDDTPPLPSSSTIGKNLYYGELYVVNLDSNVSSFSWAATSMMVSPGSTPTASSSFSVVEQADYEAIDVVDIDPSITEIGVFEGDTCVGASVVDTTAVTILAYTSEANRSLEPLSFRVIREGERSIKATKYSVLDPTTGKYIHRTLAGGDQEYSVVRLTSEESSPEVPIYGIELAQNAPNPFNPSTTISFTLNNATDVEVSVFNLRGQKVTTLLQGSANAGRNTIHWDGTDSAGRSVASGVYLYRLTAGQQTIQRRMLLLK
jgi:hypothetical protein